MLAILGYFTAVLMGITLGTIGGGGSILTVPILVYFFGLSAPTATAYSLLIVGTAAAYGSYNSYRREPFELRTILGFAAPSILAVYLTRAFILPSLPDPLLTTPFTISTHLFIMVFFAILMVVAALAMLRNSKSEIENRASHAGPFSILLHGAFTGVITGMLGAGGGFIIIPALVLFLGMRMKEAVGASLFIIAVKSPIGFLGDLQNGLELDIQLLVLMVSMTIIGIAIAHRIAHRFDSKTLQTYFAYLTLAVAFCILVHEVNVGFL